MSKSKSIFTLNNDNSILTLLNKRSEDLIVKYYNTNCLYPFSSILENNDEVQQQRENPKQEEGKLGLETVLKSLADAYLEVLKNLIPELTKSEEPEP
ncbi:4093_t:CDS:2 [Gigaspora margarita]|uniref:4093_t:CDS:1 n=1 Tax=Gigaspora margarita TaxID=4874 RepID=A0ABN7UFF2_GIGMA|nr:4093_t:CDS:2 [Gigaspora margarita]